MNGNSMLWVREHLTQVLVTFQKDLHYKKYGTGIFFLCRFLKKVTRITQKTNKLYKFYLNVSNEHFNNGFVKMHKSDSAILRGHTSSHKADMTSSEELEAPVQMIF